MRIQTALFSLLLIFSVNTNAQPQDSNSDAKAPQWQLYNEAGELTRSTDFATKPLVIHFWATWCPYCKKLQPGLDKLYKKYHTQGLELIAISFREDQGAMPQALLDARGHSFNTLVDGDHVALKLFGVKGTPATVFISRDGNILATTRTSDPNDPRLEQIIKQMVSEPTQ